MPHVFISNDFSTMIACPIMFQEMESDTKTMVKKLLGSKRQVCRKPGKDWTAEWEKVIVMCRDMN